MAASSRRRENLPAPLPISSLSFPFISSYVMIQYYSCWPRNTTNIYYYTVYTLLLYKWSYWIEILYEMRRDFSFFSQVILLSEKFAISFRSKCVRSKNPFARNPRIFKIPLRFFKFSKSLNFQNPLAKMSACKIQGSERGKINVGSSFRSHLFAEQSL